MYKSIWQITRPSVETAWPSGNPEFVNLPAQAAGFIGREVVISEDNLSKTITGQWETEQDFVNFKTANAAFFESTYAILTAYCETNGIVLAESSETV